MGLRILGGSGAAVSSADRVLESPWAAFQTARILGCSPQDARALMGDQKLCLSEVEALALGRYVWRRHIGDPESYWVTVSQAAEILGVSIQRTKQLLEKGFLPYVVLVSGVRLMRREQLETVANARASRRLQNR